MSRREESAKGMGQRSSYAVTKDAPTKFEEEESVQSMEQKEKFAAMQDVPTKPRWEGSVSGMGQQRSRNAAMRLYQSVKRHGAKYKCSRKGCIKQPRKEELLETWGQ